MRTIDMTILVTPERVVTVKLPDDVLPGEHRVRFVIDDESSPSSQPSSLFNPEGLWAGKGTDISPQDLREARREMMCRSAPPISR